MSDRQEQVSESRTAGQAGWHVSRYNISAPVPGTKNVAIANLYRGICAEYTPLELYLLSVLEELDEHHPIIERFARRGIIANFDERAALEVMGRAACAGSPGASLTICPTVGCNFNCPYCFEDHRAGKMSADVADDVVALATRMMDAGAGRALHITWFGGEPLLAPDIIESLSDRLMALADEHGATYEASIITNGYLLTQQIADMLGRCKVTSCQVTIDGMGALHDATRHLAGGGPTFERITNNLRTLQLPFKVNVRHNVHEGNRHEMDELQAFVKQMAEESGNDLTYYPAPVSPSTVGDARDEQVGILCGSDASDVGVRQEANRFRQGRGNYCGANNLLCVGVDDCGNLYKCWEAVDKPELSFGNAHDWNPTDPLRTASDPDKLTCYLNTAMPVHDKECWECVWLPECAGGCPHKRIFETRTCLPFKDNPEPYVLALHARIGENKGEDNK